jgi:hypothetical protein
MPLELAVSFSLFLPQQRHAPPHIAAASTAAGGAAAGSSQSITPLGRLHSSKQQLMLTVFRSVSWSESLNQGG